jgi:hypothetical protein
MREQARYCRYSDAGIGLLLLLSVTQAKFAALFVSPAPV